MKKDKIHNIESNGFKIPKDYFDTFEDKFFEHLDKKEFIEGTEIQGYTVPKDYFDSIEDNVFSKLNKDNKAVITLKSRKTLYYLIGIAASLIVLFAIFINKKTPEESISIEMVEAYFENSDLDSYELAELLTDADILEDNFVIINTPYEEGNLEDYLLENADIESIIE